MLWLLHFLLEAFASGRQLADFHWQVAALHFCPISLTIWDFIPQFLHHRSLLPATGNSFGRSSLFKQFL